MAPSNRHIPLNRAINLGDKEIILCSIYDDIEDAKTTILSTHPNALSPSNTSNNPILEKQLSILYTFSFYLSFVLSDLEHDLGLSIDNRYHKPRVGVDMASLGNVVSVLKDEVTNLRFLLRGRDTGFANERLRELKGLAGELGGKLRGVGDGKGDEEGKGKAGALGVKEDGGATEDIDMEVEVKDIEMGPANITSAGALIPEETPFFSDDDVYTHITKGNRTPKYAEPDEDFTPSDTTSIHSIDKDGDGDIAMKNTTKTKAPLKVYVSGKTMKAQITSQKKATPKKSTTPKKTIKLSVFPVNSPLGGIPKQGRNRKGAGGGKA